MSKGSYKLLKKIASLIARLKYRNVPEPYFYFFRDTIVCKMVQLKYFFRDYLFKSKYKTIDFSGEFGNEMQFALPHAYWHYKNGTLKATRSFPHTKELYFFSDNHSEFHTERTNAGNYNFELPRILYSQDYDIKKWLPVPFKSHFKNDIYRYEKPLLIIANRYNTEWDGPPVSYFSKDVLDQIISRLKDRYQIIYSRPQAKDIVNDNSAIYDLKEFEWLKSRHPEVIHLNDLYKENKIKARNFNHFQLCVYANCENFISIHGGTATLASYFGGKNLIFSKKGPEHYFQCYRKFYPQFSGAAIHHAATEDTLFQYVDDLF
ncbi:hypothetical protein ABDK00_010025 [Niabella insulamsoli]|uniref:hypothetical protein n=1 Tax=Niabella insulamsoli TaxID=3144874 RepID=UPI0031FC6834